MISRESNLPAAVTIQDIVRLGPMTGCSLVFSLLQACTHQQIHIDTFFIFSGFSKHDKSDKLTSLGTCYEFFNLLKNRSLYNQEKLLFVIN